MNLVLFGIKGCGKTTLGKKIAVKLGRAFVDTDMLIEDLYHINRGKHLTCHEIYKEVGPLGFRSLEYEVIQSLQDLRNSIIAVGGGAMMFLENVEALSKTSHLVYLIVEKQALKKRVLAQEDLAAFLDPRDPESSFDRLYEERDAYFRKLHATEIDISKISEEEAVKEICALHEKKYGK